MRTISDTELREHYIRAGAAGDPEWVDDLLRRTLIAAPIYRGGIISIVADPPMQNIGQLWVTAHGWICKPEFARGICLFAALCGVEFIYTYCENARVEAFLRLVGFNHIEGSEPLWMRISTHSSKLSVAAEPAPSLH